MDRGAGARRRGGVALALAALCAGCAREESGTLTVAPLVHLADRLDVAAVEAAEPGEGQSERVWKFDQARPEWRTVSSADRPDLATLATTQLADGLRLALSLPRQPQSPIFIAGVALSLDGLELDDWESVYVRARSSDRFGGVTVAYNLDEPSAVPDFMHFFVGGDEVPPIFNDGSTQTYAIPLRPRSARPHGAGPAAQRGAPADAPAAPSDHRLRELGVFFGAPGPAQVDLLEVRLVPRGAGFPDARGTRSIVRGGETRHTLFAHAPARFAWRLALPAEARLDFALTAEAGSEVTYRVAVEPAGGAREVLFDETVRGAGDWLQRTVALAESAVTATVTLEAESARPGAVAFWAAPMVSGGARGAKPNVVLYVIDGGGADLMSVYGYQRRTTPFLERLAAEEAALFEHAYSNSTWTQPSTASFMTSLHHSVLGGLRRGMHSTPVPASATTMAERFRAAGYQTGVFTSNPNCGRIIGLERGVDRLRDGETENASSSSVDLHEEFWRFRSESPGAPYWVHFQTSDVHEPNLPEPPFAHTYVTPEERARLEGWENQLFQVAGAEFGQMAIAAWYDLALERARIPRADYYRIRRGLYDETMAHQDHQLARFVERLKAKGEWENTIFVVAADHGHPAGTFARFGRGEFEPKPAEWEGALLDSYATRVPLIVSWPARIAGGRRFAPAVSMIDVLPTLLELAGLPAAEVAQGQSLAPTLLGRTQELRSVLFDEFRVDEASGELVGNLELLDGRWGASLEIGPVPPGADPARGRHAVPAGGRWGARHAYFPEAPRLLLYDLERDPFVRKAVNAEHPELVERYTRRLVELWKAQQALAVRFQSAEGDKALDPEQLRQLKALGYIQ